MIPEDPTEEQAVHVLGECSKEDLRHYVREAARRGDLAACRVAIGLDVEDRINAITQCMEGYVFDKPKVVVNANGRVDVDVSCIPPRALEHVLVDFNVLANGDLLL